MKLRVDTNKIIKNIFFLFIISISIVNISVYKSIPLSELNMQENCGDYIYHLDYSKVTNASYSQFDTSYNIDDLGEKKEVIIKPYYLSLFKDDLRCLGKIVQISQDSKEILVGASQFQFQLYKFISYIINFLILLKIKKLNLVNLVFLNLVTSYNINLLFNYDFLFTTDYKYASRYIDILDSLVISFVLIGITKKRFQSSKNTLNIKVSNNLISIIFGIYVLRIIQIYISRFQYEGVVEEWLINYNYGFIRRGLIGTGLVKFIEQLNVNVFYLFIFLIFFFNFLFFQIFRKRLKSKNLSFIDLLLLLSPLFINYNLFWKSTITFPKELLGFIFFVYYLTYQSKIRVDARYLICFIFLLNVGIYSHEINLWFLMSILLIILTKKGTRDYRLIIISLFSAITFISIYLFNISKYANTAKNLCDNFYSQILDISTCYKSSILSTGLAENIEYVSINIFQSNNYKYYLMTYILYFFLGLFPLIINNWFNENKYFLVITFLFFIPLFYTTLDWGRWLHIYFSIIYFYFLYSGSQNNTTTSENFNLNKYIETAILLIYSTYWSVPQCCVTEYTFDNLTYVSKYNFTLFISLVIIFVHALSPRFKQSNKISNKIYKTLTRKP
tara:strand:+ start:210 stop:2054 length:1845 start_codon:yes stop_codon:yes gene_type:complete